MAHTNAATPCSAKRQPTRRSCDLPVAAFIPTRKSHWMQSVWLMHSHTIHISITLQGPNLLEVNGIHTHNTNNCGNAPAAVTPPAAGSSTPLMKLPQQLSLSLFNTCDPGLKTCVCRQYTPVLINGSNVQCVWSKLRQTRVHLRVHGMHACSGGMWL